MSVESSEKKRNILLGIVALALVAAGAIWYMQSSSGPAGDPKVQAANEQLKKIQGTATEEVKKANEAPPDIQRPATKGSAPIKK